MFLIKNLKNLVKLKILIADYQNHLEKIWISDLKSKYSISINKDVLYSIIK